MILKRHQLIKIVLISGFLIFIGPFIFAKVTRNTGGKEEITLEYLGSQIQSLQSQINEAKTKLLEVIEQKLVEVKEKATVIQEEVQKKIELARSASSGGGGGQRQPERGSEGEKMAESKEMEEINVVEATTTTATTTEKMSMATSTATSTENFITEESTSTAAEKETDSSDTTLNKCGGGPANVPEIDNTPPAEITNLSASNPTFNSVTLSWTAPGDNGSSGTADSYDIRYSTSFITSENWNSANQVIGEPAPLLSGSAQSMTVSGLSPGTKYYFAIKTLDEIPNESGLSNIASISTGLPEECSTSVASGKQTYFVRTQNQPQIMQVDIDPLDVELGATQIVSAKIRDTNNNPITDVSGTVELDNSSQTFSFALVDGTDLWGTWEGSWVLNDAYCQTYFLAIEAESASGQSIVELAFK